MKYGVYGLGRIGLIHAQIVIALGHEICAIGNDSGAANENALRTLSIDADAYQSPQEMIREHPEIDAVIIASHTVKHARHSKPFVDAGVPVFLEKPLTDDLSEAFDLIRHTGTREDIIQIGLQRRFDEALCYAKELLDEGLIGDIREIRSVLRDKHPPPEGYVSRALIIDMGIHIADEAIWLTGEFPNKVWARLLEAKDYNRTIDEQGNTAFVGFTTPGGIIGRLDMSRTHSPGYNNETHVIGTWGMISVGRFSGYPGPIPVELWTADGKLDSRSKVFDMTYPKGEYPEFLPRFERAFIESHKCFADAVSNAKSFRVTQNDVLKAQVMVEAAHLSSLENGKVYDVSYSEDLEEFRGMCSQNKLLD